MSDAILANQIRPGARFELSSSLLDATSSFWSEDQKAKGISVLILEPTPDDERTAASLVPRGTTESGLPLSVNINQAMLSIASIDDVTVTAINREQIWRAMGTRGRGLVMQMFNLLTAAPSEEVTAAVKSFRRTV